MRFMWSNKTLQATAAVLCGWEVGWRHNAAVAGASALPAAVPDLYWSLGHIAHHERHRSSY
jgi:hypothetical protein